MVEEVAVALSTFNLQLSLACFAAGKAGTCNQNKGENVEHRISLPGLKLRDNDSLYVIITG